MVDPLRGNDTQRDSTLGSASMKLAMVNPRRLTRQPKLRIGRARLGLQLVEPNPDCFGVVLYGPRLLGRRRRGHQFILTHVDADGVTFFDHVHNLLSVLIFELTRSVSRTTNYLELDKNAGETYCGVRSFFFRNGSEAQRPPAPSPGGGHPRGTRFLCTRKENTTRIPSLNR